MENCRHDYERKAVYHWTCKKCDRIIIPLFFFFTKEFNKLFIKEGARAYRLHKGEIYSDVSIAKS